MLMPTSSVGAALAAAAPQEMVSLEIGARCHSFWTSYNIDSDLLLAADGWQLGLGMPQGSIPPEVAAGEKVRVTVGGEVVLLGRVDQISHSISRQGHQLNLSGRDMAGMLLDCSAPPEINSKNISLADLAQKVLTGIEGITVKVGDAFLAHRIPQVRLTPGSSMWEVIKTAAEDAGATVWFEPDGTLFIGGPDYSKEVSAHLILRRNGQGNNVLSLEETHSHVGRYSTLEVRAQSARQSNAAAKNDMKSPVLTDLNYYKPLIVVDPAAINEAQLKARAEKMMADAKLGGYTLSVTVAGHRDSGSTPGAPSQLWTPGQRIHVLSEPHGIDGVFFLMARTFIGGRSQGTLTRLTLKQDKCWIPVMAKAGQ
ncbi:phage tail protein [Neisseriaceae bacterium TC5R-5]|nr:phage tail protein [Neisseriaceae bacterium TC5R-5]